MPLTPEQRRQRAQIAANTRWAHDDGQKTGEAGQAGLMERFRREVIATYGDVLPEPELTRRAERLRRAHMTRLAFQSSKARAAKREAQA